MRLFIPSGASWDSVRPKKMAGPEELSGADSEAFDGAESGLGVLAEQASGASWAGWAGRWLAVWLSGWLPGWPAAWLLGWRGDWPAS